MSKVGNVVPSSLPSVSKPRSNWITNRNGFFIVILNYSPAANRQLNKRQHFSIYSISYAQRPPDLVLQPQQRDKLTIKPEREKIDLSKYISLYAK